MDEREPLTEVSVYEIGGSEPRLVHIRREGTVAFYGLVLESRPDRELTDYLLGSNVDSLWEYQKGFGVTPEDSCLVIDGLLAAGVDPSSLLVTAKQLVDYFFSTETGTFHSLSDRRTEVPLLARGRAPYWCGASLDATAQAAYAIARIAPDLYGANIERSARAVAAWQQADGGWRSRWYPSRYVATYYCARLLRGQCQTYVRELDRVTNWIVRHQHQDGSWGDSVISTAAAVRTLRCVQREPQACSRGIAWLDHRRNGPHWRSEPVLYYWFDFPDGRRLFHHCHDQGQIATAWAVLASSEQ